MTVNAYPDHYLHHSPQQPSQAKKKKKEHQIASPDTSSMTTTTTDNSPREAASCSQLAEHIKANHYNPSLLASSSPFLSALLRDMSASSTTTAQKRLSTSSSSPTVSSSRTISSLTLTHQPSPSSSQKEGDTAGCYNYDGNISEHHDCRSSQQQHRIAAVNSVVDDRVSIEQLQRVVEKQEREIALLKSRLAFANQILQDANAKADKAIQARRQTENELEELSAQLFEQANEMVAKERRAAKEQKDSANHELEHVRQLLDRERSLRRHLVYHSSDTKTTLSSSSSANEDNVDHYSNDGDASMIQPLMDTHGLAQFRDFVQRVRCVSIDHVHRLPFVKQCLEHDVYPCVQRMKKLSTRKLLNSLVRRPCRVVNNSIKPETTVITTSTSSPCCFGCGTPFQRRSRSHHQEEEFFLFRLNDNDSKSPWHRIDRPCKERLVAVSNFYEFVRHLHLGLQGQQRSIESLFHEMVWLRLYMFWARSGIIAINNSSSSTDNDNDSISVESTNLVTISKLFDARCSYHF
ncbi:hypothetical protein BDB00DRAFT_100134 [Zychaea mexicana]|uniref:uncharacterized protein n=1 Tax=Zychaea mexicana TaxID=64656 RepID=UPI0022FE1AD6|nr:uncharacterized protein BDB00DRAFT_100134 [Zychaea mexicana]KAI9496616.1 hypothetical protein BDB00DRAFT_100134 [Zychaea mexicana]